MLTDFCVYTIASRDKLDPVALERVPFVNQEERVWATATGMLEESQALGRGMPIIFADALDCTLLLYWGLLQEIRPLKGQTEYVVDRLRSLPGQHAPQELVLWKTGKPIAPGFIRPYAICRTPEFLESPSSAPVLLPDEEPSEGTMTEGTTMQVTVNAYERSPEARQRCIAHYGCRCVACGLDFEAVYGEIGSGFIHVHHLVPLSEIRAEYVVDPIRDLRPVCPNCHAMIHAARPPLSVEDIVIRLAQRGAAAEHQVVRRTQTRSIRK